MNKRWQVLVGDEKEWQVLIGDEIVDWHQFRKRPIVINAMQMDVPFKVETLEGWMQGQPGDWLIEGVENELYPCKDSIFQATYEEATIENKT